MSLEFFLWGVALLGVPFAGASIRGYWMIGELLRMHRAPDQSGFGTVAVTKIISQNSDVLERVADCMEDMDRVLRWMAANGMEDAPPPRIRNVRK